MKEKLLSINQSKTIKKVKARWQLYLFLLLPVIYFCLFEYVPMYGIQLAFKKFNPRLGIWGSEWIGLENFERFFNSYYFKRTIINTLRISLYTLVVNFFMPIIFALILNSLPWEKYKKVVQMVTYMPHFISTVLIVGILNQLLNPATGLYGTIYSAVTGIYTPPKDILGMAAAFPHLYVWSGIWQGLGWSSIIYISALASVDDGLHEAARIDGASRFKRVLHIDIPCIAPTIVTLLIMKCGSVMSV